MRGVNKVIIVGNLGADPEHRTFANGGSVTNISVATSEQWTDKQTGERKEATEWHRIALFNRLGEIAAQYLRKGSQVYIEGSLRTRKWQDQNGQDRYTTEIRADNMQMLGGVNNNQSSTYGNTMSGNPNEAYGQNNQAGYQNPQNANLSNNNNHNNANNFNNQNRFANNTASNQGNGAVLNDMNSHTQGAGTQQDNLASPSNTGNQGNAGMQNTPANQNNPKSQNNVTNNNSATTNNTPMSDAPVDDDIPF